VEEISRVEMIESSGDTQWSDDQRRCDCRRMCKEARTKEVVLSLRISLSHLLVTNVSGRGGDIWYIDLNAAVVEGGSTPTCKTKHPPHDIALYHPNHFRSHYPLQISQRHPAYLALFCHAIGAQISRDQADHEQKHRCETWVAK